MAEGNADRGFPWPTVRLAVFLGLFYLWVWLAARTDLHYESLHHFPPFLTGWAFFRGFLAYPGGLTEYVSAFLAQSYYAAWTGALMAALIATLMCLATDVIVRAWAGEGARVLAFGPAIVLLVALDRHLAQVSAMVGPACVLLAVAGYVRLPQRRDGLRVAVFLLGSVLVYYAVAGPYVLFALMAALYEAVVLRRRLPALVALLAMEGVPYLVGAYGFAFAPVAAFAQGTPFADRTDAVAGPPGVALYGYAALVGPMALLASHIATRCERPVASRLGKLAPAIALLTVLAGGLAAALLTYDPVGLTNLRIILLERQRDWEGVLREARRLPRNGYAPVASQHINRALYETGRLPAEMFSFAQSPGSLLLDSDLGRDPKTQDERMAKRTAFFSAIGDLDLQLGLVNEAEHEAHESLVDYGPRPQALMRLALVNIVKRQPEAARVLLSALSRNLVQGCAARKLLGRLDVDPQLSDDLEIARVRSVMLTRDQVGQTQPIGARCLALLDANPHNRMAFEYLMAYCLLTRQLDQFAANLPRMRGLGYTALPRHYAEAILVYELDPRKRADRCGWEVPPAIERSFWDFRREVARASMAGDVAAVAKSLAPRFGNTYFYYESFGESGVGQR